MPMIPAQWLMEPDALTWWLRQSSDRLRLGASLFLDFDPARARPYELLDGGIAVIPIAGPLSKADKWWSMGGSYLVASNQVRQALTDSAVKALLLDVDSPGGECSGVQELATSIDSADAVKPVYAWADGTCCSAAYWLASRARTLAVTPITYVGSIGVVGVHLEISKAAESAGYTFTVIKSGKEKAFGNSYEPLSPEALASIQGRMDGIYSLFVSEVAAARGLDEAKARDWADGRVFLAQEGLGAGLIDRVQNRDEFLASIREEIMDKKVQMQIPGGQAAQGAGPSAEAAASPDVAAITAQSVQSGRDEVLALVGVVAGEDVKARVETAMAAGLTGESLAAAALIVGASSSGGESPAAAAKPGAMLDALRRLDADGVKHGAKSQGAASNANYLVDHMARQFGGAK